MAVKERVETVRVNEFVDYVEGNPSVITSMGMLMDAWIESDAENYSHQTMIQVFKDFRAVQKAIESNSNSFPVI